MHSSKSRWPQHALLVVSIWIGMARLLAAAPESEAASPATPAESPSSHETIGSEGPRAETPEASSVSSADEASNGPSRSAGGAPASAEEPLDSSGEVAGEGAQPEPEEPTGSNEQASEQPAQEAAENPPESADEELAPIPDPQYSEPASVETASFNGVTPGVTTLEEIETAWGAPKEMANRNAQLVHLYSIEPFERVEVSFAQNRVAAVAIRLENAFPADVVAEQLELLNIRPVLISNELGEVLGQSFPERGVLFVFEPSEVLGKASMRVNQIIIEPVSAESFVLRAETYMDSQIEPSLRDLEEAIKLDPKRARAHWLRSRLLAAAGNLDAALEASGEATALAPNNPQYRATGARILGQLGRFAEGIDEAQKALADSTKRPHVKARTLCLLGDLLSSSTKPDYRQAAGYHMEAIRVADSLAVDRHPAIRLAAKEVLIDAHLGAAHDIAWGEWEKKEQAVPRWIERAAAVAEDLVENEGGSAEHQFRVATRALAAFVGLRDRLDPTPWAEETLDVAERLLADFPESPRKQQLRWDLVTALYDAVQIYQMRGEHDAALEYGSRAIGYLERSGSLADAGFSETYLLGRLYFRLGAIHAVGRQDHAAAISWFEKAIPVFEKTATNVTPTEFGRLGETYVSMGVSYWEEGQRDRAVRLTQRGAELMHQAVSIGALRRSALEIPYSNLAAMSRHLGDEDQADKYLEEAKRYQASAQR